MLAVGLAGLMDPLRIDRPRNYARQAQFVINVMISWGIYVSTTPFWLVMYVSTRGKPEGVQRLINYLCKFVWQDIL